jgi:predicted HTH domain antitoxin
VENTLSLQFEEHDLLLDARLIATIPNSTHCHKLISTMSEITINLPEEVFSARRQPPEQFVQEMRLAAAMYWYSKGELSQEKAAQIAGLNRRDFLAALAREEVDVMSVDWHDLERELNRG